MPPEPRPLPAEREAAAVEVLRRIYEADTGYPLYDEGMAVDFADREIAAFIRKFGPLPCPRRRPTRDEVQEEAREHADQHLRSRHG